MLLIGYARVSTVDQYLTLQLEALKAKGCEEFFYAKHLGVSDENETKLAELIRYIRKDDAVIVTKLDRIGRSLKSILAAIDAIHAKKATLRTLVPAKAEQQPLLLVSIWADQRKFQMKTV
jgi:DNA invertase Pin-like site-specific DNA recombinase